MTETRGPLEALINERCDFSVGEGWPADTVVRVSFTREGLIDFLAEAFALGVASVREAGVPGIDYEELEARLCPEDFGFEEFIAHLQKTVAASEGLRWKAEQAIVRLMREKELVMAEAEVLLTAERTRATQREKKLADAAEMLWVVLANVSGGDWTKQTPDWQEAAARWRDNYFAALHGDDQ